jgi:hypothetical protein
MILLLALGACSQQAEQQQSVPQNEQQPPLATQESSATNELHPPGPREPLEEPRGPIDPKSAEAAGQVVQSYGALIEQGRWAEANALWGSADAAAKFQATAFADAKEVHLGIGNLGEPEGAAGSIYVTMPVIFYGDGKDGKPFRRSAEVILRRVNDVPGSTEAQRRWHIERIDFSA